MSTTSVKKIVLAYSGGLDTSVIVPWLKENYAGAEVICFVANIGQNDDLTGIEAKALASGAAKCVVKDLRDHPLKQMLDAGLCVTVNSDDPAYFGGYMNANFEQTALSLGLSREDVVLLAKNSFEASFIGPERRRACIEELERVAAT